jgi:hypothetical protein
MTHAWWHPFDWFQGDGGGGENMPPGPRTSPQTYEDNFMEWVTAGGDPQAYDDFSNFRGRTGRGNPQEVVAVDPIAEILRKEDAEWESRRRERALQGINPPPPWTLTDEERRRQILAEKPISQGGTLLTEDVSRGWKHENQIMELFQQGIINETDAKHWLYVWFINPDHEDGTKYWPDRPFLDASTAEGIAEGRKLSFDAFDSIIDLWKATEQEIPPLQADIMEPTIIDEDNPLYKPEFPLDTTPSTGEITTTTTPQVGEIVRTGFNPDELPETDDEWKAATGQIPSGVDTGAGYYDTITGQWVKGDLSPEEIRRQTRIAQEDDYQGMQNIFNQFLTTQPMHTLSGYGQEAARAMQQPLYYSYLAGQPMPGEARDELLFQQFLNQEGGPQIMDPTEYTQRLIEIGGFMGGVPPTEKGALAEWDRAQAPYRKNIDAFNAWLQPAMYNVAPAFRSGVYAAARNIYDTFMEANPEQSFMGEMARTEGMFPSSMVTGGYT